MHFHWTLVQCESDKGANPAAGLPRPPTEFTRKSNREFSSPREGEGRRARTCDSKCALARLGEGNVLRACPMRISTTASARNNRAPRRSG